MSKDGMDWNKMEQATEFSVTGELKMGANGQGCCRERIQELDGYLIKILCCPLSCSRWLMTDA